MFVRRLSSITLPTARWHFRGTPVVGHKHNFRDADLRNFMGPFYCSDGGTLARLGFRVLLRHAQRGDLGQVMIVVLSHKCEEVNGTHASFEPRMQRWSENIFLAQALQLVQRCSAHRIEPLEKFLNRSIVVAGISCFSIRKISWAQLFFSIQDIG